VSRAALLRWGSPLAIAVAGVIVALAGAEAPGEGIIGAAACVALGTWFLRFSFSDNAEREKEEAARVYFGEHGHWPDEEP
jgi:hypothetical protein